MVTQLVITFGIVQINTAQLPWENPIKGLFPPSLDEVGGAVARIDFSIQQCQAVRVVIRRRTLAQRLVFASQCGPSAGILCPHMHRSSVFIDPPGCWV